MKPLSLTIATGMALVLFLGACATRPPIRAVDQVDLKRYSGKWYEIARLPVSFQRGCVASTAEYTPNSDGSIAVVNRCVRKDGQEAVAKATAWPVAGSNGSTLRVQFFWPIRGLYQVIGLDEENYSWAVVAGPRRGYLWFLAREPEVSTAVYDRMVAIARNQEFATERLIRRGQP